MAPLIVTAPSWGAPAINSTTCNYPFPQNASYSYGIKPNHKTAAQFQSDVTAMYTVWYNNAVTNTGVNRTSTCSGCYRVYRGSDGNDTVSEGIGYGMLIASVLADKPLFDGIWNYAKQYMPDANGNYVMDWHISSSGSVAGTNGATDADEDMVEGLLIAHKQWGSLGTINYLSQAQSMMAAIWSKEIDSTNANGSGAYSVQPGDGWTGTLFSSYMCPAWYKCWPTFDPNSAHKWASVGTWVYGSFYKSLLASYPKGYKPENTNASFSPNSQSQGYDASRYPWRTGLDYLWNGDSGAASNVGAMATNVMAGGLTNIKEYWDIGTGNASGSANSLQIDGALVACMSQSGTTAQTFVNNTYDEMVNNRFAGGGSRTGFTYFQDSLCMICELIATGNFPNFACGTLGPTPTPGSPTATPTRTLTPTVTMTPVPANLTLTKSTSSATSNYTTGSIPMTLVVCNTSSSIAANSVTVIDQTTNYGWMSFNGPNYSSWSVTLGGTPVTITPLNTSSFPMTWTINTLPGSGCVTIPFNPINYTYAATQACQVMSDYGSASWSGGGPVTSNSISITMQCSTTSTATPSPTRTATGTATRTFTPTSTATATFTSTPVNTATSTATRTSTPTYTATALPTATNTPTATATRTSTSTATSTGTATSTPVYTATASSTPTPTATRTATGTPVSTATSTSTGTPTNTVQFTLTATPTGTATFTRTATPTVTSTPSGTPTSTFTSTRTSTPTWTVTFTGTPSSTPTTTSTATVTSTPTLSFTPTWSVTGTQPPTDTFTSTPTRTATGTSTATPTTTSTFSATHTATSVPTSTWTGTATTTATPTATFSSTPTRTSTTTATPTSTPTGTATLNPTDTATSVPTSTWTGTATATATPTPTWTATSVFTGTPTASGTPTATASATWTPTFTLTATHSSTPTATPIATSTWSFTTTATFTPTPTRTWTPTPTPSVTSTGTTVFTSTPVGGGVNPVVYPNPSNGDELRVAFNCDTAVPSMRLDIVTAANRMVYTGVLAGNGRGGFQVGRNAVRLNLRSLNLANGLYYVVVRLPNGGKGIGKMMIAR